MKHVKKIVSGLQQNEFHKGLSELEKKKGKEITFISFLSNNLKK